MTEIVRKENKHGIKKDYVRVDIGTSVLEVPKRIRNPVTERTHDLTKLSDNGYLKTFLALKHEASNPNVVDMRTSPVLSFDKDKWDVEETEDRVIITDRSEEGY